MTQKTHCTSTSGSNLSPSRRPWREAVLGAPTAPLFRSLRVISFAKSARPLSAAAESYGKQATVAVLWRQTGRLVKKESLLSDLVVRNKQLGELLLKTKLAQGDKATSEVVTVFFLEKHQRKVHSKRRREEHLVDR